MIYIRNYNDNDDNNMHANKHAHANYTPQQPPCVGLLIYKYHHDKSPHVMDAFVRN